MVRSPKQDNQPTGMRPNFGRGMFPDDGAKASAVSVLSHLHPLLIAQNINLSGGLEAQLLTSLQIVCYEYPHDCAYDSEVNVSRGLIEIRNIQRQANKLEEALTGISDQAEYAINTALWSASRKDERRATIDLFAQIFRLNAACQAALKTDGKKRKPIALSNCCKRLWNIKEQLSGSFARKFDLAPGTKGFPEFTSPDALFIQVALAKIDANVKASTIQYELQELSKRKSNRR